MYRRFLRRNKIRRVFDIEEESIYTNKPGYNYVPYIIVSSTSILHSSNINKKIKSRYNLC